MTTYLWPHFVDWDFRLRKIQWIAQGRIAEESQWDSRMDYHRFATLPARNILKFASQTVALIRYYPLWNPGEVNRKNKQH